MGIKKKITDGKTTVPVSRFLGYDKVKYGEFIVNEKETEVIRYIYKSIIDELSAARIAKILTEGVIFMVLFLIISVGLIISMFLKGKRKNKVISNCIALASTFLSIFAFR